MVRFSVAVNLISVVRMLLIITIGLLVSAISVAVLLMVAIQIRVHGRKRLVYVMQLPKFYGNIPILSRLLVIMIYLLKLVRASMLRRNILTLSLNLIHMLPKSKRTEVNEIRSVARFFSVHVEIKLFGKLIWSYDWPPTKESEVRDEK